MDHLEVLHKRYAQALIDYAYANDCHRKVLGDFEKMNILLRENSSLFEIMLHPEISREEKFNLINKISKYNKFCREFKNFLFLLLKGNRFKLLHGVFLKYRDLYDQRQGQIKIFLRSAFRLDSRERQRLVKVLESKLKKDVVLKELISPELLAGLAIQVGDNIFDNSISRNLKLLNQEFKKQ